MLEKTSDIGGSTVQLRRPLGLRGHREQVAQGIADSVDLLRKDLLEIGRRTSTTSAWWTSTAQHQLETYDWLTDHGVRYGEVHAASGQSAPRSHPTDTTAMLVAPAQGSRPARRPAGA